MACASWIFLNFGVEVVEEVLMLFPVALLGVDWVEMFVPKGFGEVPPAAVRRFRLAVPIMSCIIIFAEGLLEEIGGPVRWAQIQVDCGSVKDMELAPLFQVLQFVPANR